MHKEQLEQLQERPDILRGLICPYCEKPTELVEAREVYGDMRGVENFEKRYFCKPCDAHVGVHPGTEESLGSLADKNLRRARKNAKALFKPLWLKAIKRGREKGEARRSAYKWLAKGMNLTVEYCHFGYFSLDQCDEAMEFLNKYYKSLKRES